jgi:hypothetical protein
MIYGVLVDQPVSLLGQDGVVEAGDGERGVVNAVTFQAAVEQDLLALHSGEDVFDAGAGFAVGAVVVFFPGR